MAEIERQLEAPLVVREVGDPELHYFESCDDLFGDRFDILWADNYEGWDSRGFYFTVKRCCPEPTWWQRLCNQDPSYLELVSVTEQSPIDIQRLLETELGIDYQGPMQERVSVGRLIRFGLKREMEQAKVVYYIR